MLDSIKYIINILDLATVILLLILLLGGWILWKVQVSRTTDFKFEEMLRDESNKPSAFRLAIFVCLAVSTWVIMYIVLKTNTIDTWIFVTYVTIWSGAKVAESALVAYSGKSGLESMKASPQRRPRRDDIDEELEKPKYPVID